MRFSIPIRVRPVRHLHFRNHRGIGRAPARLRYRRAVCTRVRHRSRRRTSSRRSLHPAGAPGGHHGFALHPCHSAGGHRGAVLSWLGEAVDERDRTPGRPRPRRLCGRWRGKIPCRRAGHCRRRPRRRHQRRGRRTASRPAGARRTVTAQTRDSFTRSPRSGDVFCSSSLPCISKCLHPVRASSRLPRHSFFASWRYSSTGGRRHYIVRTPRGGGLGRSGPQPCERLTLPPFSSPAGKEGSIHEHARQDIPHADLARHLSERVAPLRPRRRVDDGGSGHSPGDGLCRHCRPAAGGRALHLVRAADGLRRHGHIPPPESSRPRPRSPS